MQNFSEFFIVVPIGFEALAAEELAQWLEHLEVGNYKTSKEKGGLSLYIDKNWGYYLNYCLKIPVRILLRVKSFTCRDFSKFFQRLAKVGWRNYLDLGDIHWEISSHGSRLYNKKKIAEVAQESYEKFKKASPPKKNSSTHDLNVYIRIVDDLCMVSIDTSGAPMYQRGYKNQSVIAPIRENLASGLLTVLGFDSQRTLVDPMMGSGSFLTEAEVRFKCLKGLRTWSFENFKDYKEKNTHHLSVSTFRQYWGRDISNLSLKATKEHLENLKVKKFDIQVENLFHSSESTQGGWLIVNPPYGDRLQVVGQKKQDFKALMAQMIRKYDPHKMGIILPSFSLKGDQVKVSNRVFKKKIFFKNGGIPVEFWLGD